MSRWRGPLRGVTRENIGREMLAGVTLLAIAIPLNIGYAQTAGLPATAGLYALVFPAIAYTFVVSSRQVVVSPDAAAAALVFSSLTALGVAGENFAVMAAAQAILSGAMFIAASLLKLGFLSKPILIGFVGGLALDILVSQTAKMLGISVARGGEFVEKTGELLGSLAEVNPWSLGMSVLAIAILLGGRRLAPIAPWALVVLVLGSLATWWLNLESRGVAVLGEVTAGPPTFAVPHISVAEWLSLIPSALALTMVTIAEGLLVSRSYAEKNVYRTKPNRDLFAFGTANVLAGLFSSFAVGSSTSRTAAMDAASSRTQLPTLVTAVGALLLLLFGTSILATIPAPAIGAVVAVAVVRLLGLGELKALWAQSRSECLVGASCFVGVLVLGPLGGLGLAFVLSLVNLARRAAHPRIDLLGPADGSPEGAETVFAARSDLGETAPGVVILRFAAPVFFANGVEIAEGVKDRVRLAPVEVSAVVLDLEGVSDIDVTGAEALAGVREWLERRGLSLSYSRARSELRGRLAHFGLTERTAMFATNREAVDTLRTDTECAG
ncbi:SulP family inorganic anion transporter [Leucobacter aridicollis]|uniref:SulP family inorganic anion transporter n=1 Tax=Leucobacter aridicollis TaxID=283878 RepID=UPI0021048F18|nr:SulP family inorganic anion transporter [Leucobacter aridicollis]UTX52009.1 SulP family inorganic anion transporter [Leucobacter aridicollis]